MKRFQIADAAFEMGPVFVEYGAAISRDLPFILAGHVREAYEPGMLVEAWGGRIASYWRDGDNVVVVETASFSAPGWSGVMTHVEVIDQTRYGEHVTALERGEFGPVQDQGLSFFIAP